MNAVFIQSDEERDLSQYPVLPLRDKPVGLSRTLIAPTSKRVPARVSTREYFTCGTSQLFRSVSQSS